MTSDSTLPDPPRSWQILLDVLLNPSQLMQGSLEYLVVWSYTRPWSCLLWYAPVLLLFTVVTTIALVGANIDDDVLVARYAKWYEQRMAVGQSDASGAGEAVSTGEESSSDPSRRQDDSQVVGLLLRRILQMQEGRQSSMMLTIAMQLERQGRIGQARAMMRELAPRDRNGNPEAHAWLAFDRLKRIGVQSEEDRDLLLHDLSNAVKWDGCSAELLATYAGILEQMNRPQEALDFMQQAAVKDARFQISLANMAARHNRRDLVRAASTSARARLQSKVNSGDADAEDYAQLANLALLNGELDRAIELASGGLRTFGNDRSLRRLLSEALRLQFRTTADTSGGTLRVHLELLDAALKADPENASVTEELARIVAMGAQLPPAMVEELERRLTDGKATAVTHLILASKALRDGDLDQARPHLELALSQAPNNPVVLNNLAICVARSPDADLDRAVELIDRAVAILPNSAEVRDTRGEILMRRGELAEAIKEFERAIQIDPNRVITRRKLADAYDQFGLGHLARLQRQKADQLEAEQSQPQEQSQPRESSQQQTVSQP
ncbi:MAG: hypothetical protein KatS3mg111_2757 [Pirellulaceae bacterium]|nr:MAG: hypothetical protein KatS3mg111_2757 [Pirellulaceae bacterium]